MKPYNPKYPLNGIVVAVACSGNPEFYQYRGVDLFMTEQLFAIKLGEATKDIASYLAVVHALGYCVKWKMMNLKIYTDSDTVLSWIENSKVDISLPKTLKNEYAVKLLTKAEAFLIKYGRYVPIEKWDASIWGKNPAGFKV